MKVNDIVTHKGKGRYEIIARVERSRTKFVIRDVDKGKGWSHTEMRHKGLRLKNGWCLGKNHSYGHTFISHQKNLNKIT